MKIFTGIFLLICFSALHLSNAQSIRENRIFLAEDVRLVEEKLNFFSPKSNLPIALLITEIGLSFLGTPYVAATLENGLEEKLVINL